MRVENAGVLLSHTADALLLALTAVHIRVSFITGSRLAATEISSGKLSSQVTERTKAFGFRGESGWGCWSSAKAGMGTGSYDFLSPVIYCYHCVKGGA